VAAIRFSHVPDRGWQTRQQRGFSVTQWCEVRHSGDPLGLAIALWNVLDKETAGEYKGAVNVHWRVFRRSVFLASRGAIATTGCITPEASVELRIENGPASSRKLISRRITMKRISIVMLVLCTCLALAAWSQAPAKHKITTFDVPGAGTGSGQGTEGAGIVDDGSVDGYYIDSNNVAHGFFRSSTGHISKFDPKGSVNTFPIGQNSTHSIVGYYLDSAGVLHGFTRSSSGKIKTVDAPGTGNLGTILEDINDSGEIAGFYYDSNGVLVGLVRSSAGKFKTFEAPGTGTGSGQGTGMAGFDGLTDAGAIAVDGIDSNGVNHGYLRTPGGKYTEFDPTGSVNTYVTGINTKNTIVGEYFDSNGAVHGFVRKANGTITQVDVTGAIFTSIYNINSSGASVGPYVDSSGVYHGFVRSPGGGISTFSVPGATIGTIPGSNNTAGSITGNWIDSAGVNHGFVRQ